jgi:glycerol-3-phosphate acyltransferase PlsY
MLLFLIIYIIGSVPFGYLVSRFLYNIDVTKVGSGNIGATNVTRVAGKFAGRLVFILDGLKGAIPVAIAMKYYDVQSVAIIALLALVGHTFSMFMKFKGGKGVATAVATILVLDWRCFVVFALCWLIVFYTTRYVSLASIVAIFSATAANIILYYYYNTTTVYYLYYLIFASILITIRHSENITKLFNGSENKFKKPC